MYLPPGTLRIFFGGRGVTGGKCDENVVVIVVVIVAVGVSTVVSVVYISSNPFNLGSPTTITSVGAPQMSRYWSALL